MTEKSQTSTTAPTVSFTGSAVTMYDNILGPVYFEPYAIDMAARVAALKPQKVLETACGTGRVTNHLSKSLSPGGTLIASDISPDMLAVAKQKLFAEKNISWLEADALNLPFEDNYFDVVVCQFGAMFFPDRQKGFNEAWRALKKGGTYMLSVWDKLDLNDVAAAGRKIVKDFFEDDPPPGMNEAFMMTDRDELRAMLTGAGFAHIKIEIVTKPCIAESAARLAAAIVDGSTVSNHLARKDASAAPLLKEKIELAIKEKFGDHPVRGTMQAIIITAEKKG